MIKQHHKSVSCNKFKDIPFTSKLLFTIWLTFFPAPILPLTIGLSCILQFFNLLYRYFSTN